MDRAPRIPSAKGSAVNPSQLRPVHVMLSVGAAADLAGIVSHTASRDSSNGTHNRPERHLNSFLLELAAHELPSLICQSCVPGSSNRDAGCVSVDAICRADSIASIVQAKAWEVESRH